MVKVTQALVAPSLRGPLRIQYVRLNQLRPDEALVEIHAVGICHADISCLNGTIPVPFPNVFGHEGLLLLLLLRRVVAEAPVKEPASFRRSVVMWLVSIPAIVSS